MLYVKYPVVAALVLLSAQAFAGNVEASDVCKEFPVPPDLEVIPESQRLDAFRRHLKKVSDFVRTHSPADVSQCMEAPGGDPATRFLSTGEATTIIANGAVVSGGKAASSPDVRPSETNSVRSLLYTGKIPDVFENPQYIISGFCAPGGVTVTQGAADSLSVELHGVGGPGAQKSFNECRTQFSFDEKRPGLTWDFAQKAAPGFNVRLDVDGNELRFTKQSSVFEHGPMGPNEQGDYENEVMQAVLGLSR